MVGSVTQISKLIIWCFFALWAVLPQLARADQMSIHVVDVGQGDAMVLHQPAACTMLIDTGLPVHAKRVTQTLEKLHVKRLDRLIITHPHIDHYGSIFEIISRFPINGLLDNGAGGEPRDVFEKYQQLRRSYPYRALASGDSVQCGDISMQVLHPDSLPAPASNLNDTSLVLLISYADFRLLHMGDLAGDAAARFVAGRSDLKADLIKVAHHGYEDSASPELLDMVDPDYAVISTSGESCIGNSCSPARSVLDRLEEHGVAVFRTDRDGDILIVVSEEGYRVGTQASP